MYVLWGDRLSGRYIPDLELLVPNIILRVVVGGHAIFFQSLSKKPLLY